MIEQFIKGLSRLIGRKKKWGKKPKMRKKMKKKTKQKWEEKNRNRKKNVKKINYYFQIRPETMSMSRRHFAVRYRCIH